MQTFTKLPLSLSTNGKQISVTGTGSVSATPIHTAVSGVATISSSVAVDEIYIYASNNSTSSLTCSILWGGTDPIADGTSVILPPNNSRTLIADGKLLQNGLLVAAYCTQSKSGIVIDGFVNRISDTSIDPFVTNWVQKVLNNNGPLPSYTTQLSLSTFYRGLVNTGLAAKMITVNCFVPDSITASFTPLIRGAGYDMWNNNNFTGSDLTVSGLKGDGSVRYLDTGIYIASAYTNDASNGITIYNTFADTSTATDFGAQGASVSEFGLYFDQGGQTFFVSWDETASGLISGSTPASTGYLSGNRISASEVRTYYASSTVPHQQFGQTGTATSNTRANLTSNLFCFVQSTTGGTPIGTKSKKRFSFVAVHLGLTLTESSNLFNLVQTLRQNLGGGFV
jgi:hypothetical protein